MVLKNVLPPLHDSISTTVFTVLIADIWRVPLLVKDSK